MVDTKDLKSFGFGCAGSSPASGTNKKIAYAIFLFYLWYNNINENKKFQRVYVN